MIVPLKLKKGDEIRIIAPARSLYFMSDELIKLARENLEKQGFEVTFSKHCKERDIFNSSPVESRVEDIHDAFSDKNVKAVLAAMGGFNSNQLLRSLDYGLIKNNPKILCGYSDITALTNAITAKTGLITYSGPLFSTWSMEKEFEYILEYFKKCLVEEREFEVKPSKTWSDDSWHKDQENRKPIDNEGIAILNRGRCEGTIYGGNLCTFNLLQGTEFMPDISNSILFIEDDEEIKTHHFDRDLESLICQTNFERVKGLVIGRFQKETEMSMEKLKHIIATKKELKNLPVIANVDFGHTDPLITFPIGGTARLEAYNNSKLTIYKH